jgi:hypothetical protein
VAPQLSFDVDEILRGKRNGWLPDLHVTTNFDFQSLAEGIRQDRSRTAEAMEELAQRWAKDKPSFAEVLSDELNSLATANIGAIKHAVNQTQQGIANADWLQVVDGTGHKVVRQLNQLRAFFEQRGVATDASAVEVVKFWRWDGNHGLPHHRISFYLFAACARKMAADQRKPPTRGFMNDVRTISTYAPYVDAMFVDNECAAFLAEKPLSTDLKFKAKIFSLNSRAAFLEYLDQIAGRATGEVRVYAKTIYGYDAHSRNHCGSHAPRSILRSAAA